MKRKKDKRASCFEKKIDLIQIKDKTFTGKHQQILPKNGTQNFGLKIHLSIVKLNLITIWDISLNENRV